MKLNLCFFGLMTYMSAMGASVLQPISIKSKSMPKQLIRTRTRGTRDGLNSSTYCRTLITEEQCHYPVNALNYHCCLWTAGECYWPGDVDSVPDGDNGICQFTEPHYAECPTIENENWNGGYGSCDTYNPESAYRYIDYDFPNNGHYCLEDGACSACPCACSGHVDCHAYTQVLRSSCSSNPLHNSDGPPPGYSGYSEAKAACEADPLCGGFQDRSCNFVRDTADDFFLCPVMDEWRSSSSSCVYEKRYDAPRRTLYPTPPPTCDSWSGC